MVRSSNAYFNILAAQDELRVAEAEREATGRQLEQAQQRFDVGLIAITDVHEARAAFDSARAAEIAAENEVDNAWAGRCSRSSAPARRNNWRSWVKSCS